MAEQKIYKDIKMDASGQILRSNLQNIFTNNSTYKNIEIIDASYPIGYINSLSQLFQSSSIYYGTANKFANLVNINITMNTSKVNSTYEMFANCIRVKNIPLFDTSNVTQASEMFYSCSNLTNIPEYNFNKVTSGYRMFQNCSNLKNIPNSFTFPNLQDATEMFFNCRNLNAIPNLNYKSIKNISSMFGGCWYITRGYGYAWGTFPNFDMANRNIVNSYRIICRMA